MSKKNSFDDVLGNLEIVPQNKKSEQPKRKLVGRVILITPTKIILEVDGNSTFIDRSEKHSGLKIGDSIDI